MKVACLQFAPEVGKVEENIARAEKVLQNTHLPDDLDWLVLPELAFTGMSAYRGLRTED
jgi:protein N-terminal amidase